MSRGGGVVSSQLSPKTRDQLYHHQLAVNELLRHFWACFPILNPQLEEKVFISHIFIKNISSCFIHHTNISLPIGRKLLLSV